MTGGGRVHARARDAGAAPSRCPTRPRSRRTAGAGSRATRRAPRARGDQAAPPSSGTSQVICASASVARSWRSSVSLHLKPDPGAAAGRQPLEDRRRRRAGRSRRPRSAPVGVVGRRAYGGVVGDGRAEQSTRCRVRPGRPSGRPGRAVRVQHEVDVDLVGLAGVGAARAPCTSASRPVRRRAAPARREPAGRHRVDGHDGLRLARGAAGTATGTGRGPPAAKRVQVLAAEGDADQGRARAARSVRPARAKKRNGAARPVMGRSWWSGDSCVGRIVVRSADLLGLLEALARSSRIGAHLSYE